MEQYNWDKETAENRVDQVIEHACRENGLHCHVHWEDREVFLIEEGLSSKQVATTLVSLFPKSKIVKEKRKGIFSRFIR